MTFFLLAAISAVSSAADLRALPIDHLTASGEQPPKYAAMAAIDGDPRSNWAVSNQLPVWIRAGWDRPQFVSRIRLRQSPATRIYDNIARLALSFSDGSRLACELGDRWEEQVIALPRRQVEWVRLTVESTYKTSYYVGISELAIEDEGPIAAARSGVQVTPPTGLPSAGKGRPSAARPSSVASVRGAEADVADPVDLIKRLAPPTASDCAHPNLMVNAEDVERAKVNIRKHPWARRTFAALLRDADQWRSFSESDLRAIVPARRAVFDHPALCPQCQGSCIATLERVGKAFCAQCKKTYPDAEHPDDGSGWKDPRTGKVTHFVGLYNEMAVDRITTGAADLAHAYVLTGDEQYARILSVLLDALAVIYPTCDQGPKWYPGVGGRLNRPFYQTARTLIYYANDYDLTRGSAAWDQPSRDAAAGSRRDNFTKNLLRNGATYCFEAVTKSKVPPALHNGNCDYLQGALAVGRVLGIQEYVDYVLESDLSIFHFIENTIDRDGQYYETSFAYSHHATDLFGHHAEMLFNYRSPKHPQGVNLYDLPKLRQNYLRAESDVDCAGHLPALGDSGPDLLRLPSEDRKTYSPIVHQRLETLLARTTDPDRRREVIQRLRDLCGDQLARRRGELGSARWLLFHADDLPPETGRADSPRAGKAIPPVTVAGPGAASSRSTLLPGARGIGILRTGTPSVGETCALVRYGATLNHGSPDELNLNLFALGREISFDPGYGWAHHRSGWAHTTIAHNLVAVNETNQLQGKIDGSGGSLERFACAAGIQVVAADDPAGYWGEGVRRYRRLIALVDLAPGIAYVLDVFDVAGGRQHDLSWHFAGELETTDGLKVSQPQTAGSLAGRQFEWWKHVRPTGWIAGQDKPFYWAAPPGNGYGFLYNLRHANITGGTPTLSWNLGQRPRTRPAGAVDPASALVGASSPCRQGESGWLLPLSKAGDFGEFGLSVSAYGNYLLVARFRHSPRGASFVAKVDGKPVGQTTETFSPVAYLADPVVLACLELKAGSHQVRFEAAADQPDGEIELSYMALSPLAELPALGKEEREGVRLHLVAPKDAQLVLADAKGLANAPVATYAIARRRGENLNSRFVSLVEPFAGQPQVQALLPVGSAPDRPSVIAVRSAGNRLDYFFDSSADATPGEIRGATLPDRHLVLDQPGMPSIRFHGQFAVVRTVAGKPSAVLLSAATEFRCGDLEISVPRAEYRGRVVKVDYPRSLIQLDSLPDMSATGDGLAYFDRDEYSRNAPYRFIALSRSEQGFATLDLGRASLSLASGRVASEISAQGEFQNAIPLDREKTWGRRLRSRWFDGKAIRNLRTGSLGRIDHAEMDASIKLTQNPGLQRGDAFDLLDIQAGDRCRIPSQVTLTTTGENRWQLSTNTPLAIRLPGLDARRYPAGEHLLQTPGR